MCTVSPVFLFIKACFSEIKSIAVPAFCYVCRTCYNVQDGLCVTCRKQIIPIVSMPLLISQRTITVYAATHYDGPLRALTLKKNYGVVGASRVLGALIYEHTSIRYKNYDVIVPVPLHWTRYAWRWFNQSEIIARVLHEKMGVPVVPLVRRTMRTRFQVGLSKKERHTNLKNVFSLHPDAHAYKGKRILVVDDVCTTGTTIKEVCRVLAVLEPELLEVAVACRVV